LQLGLVNYVVPAGEEVLKAKELIEKIATKAPLAISKIIETVNAYYEEGVDGFWKEVDAFGECCGTEDFLEGAAAFVEKRKANFKGK
jgi:enoyl-CoA hydratase